MDARLQREREFHNDVFTRDGRASLDGIYAVSGRSRELYKERIFGLARGGVALEYGCGTGSYALHLARRGARVFGIDISDEAISMARALAEREGLAHRVTFQVMNAESLQFETDSFDLICGTGILHHLQLDRALAEIARTLKDEGRAVFLEPLGHNPFINAFRRLTPRLRTQDEHPLRMRDLELARAFFEEVEPRYYHLLTFAALPLRGVPGGSSVLRALESADDAVFRLFPRAGAMAWRTVLELAKPLGRVRNLDRAGRVAFEAEELPDVADAGRDAVR